MASSTAANTKRDALQTIRIPLVGMLLPRAVGDKDQRYINAYVESVPNPLTGQKDYHLIKRPGLDQNTSVTSGVGRGVYVWKGTLISVVGDTIYAGTTAYSTTMGTSTGRVDFVETNSTDTTPALCIADGSTTLYRLTGVTSSTAISTTTMQAAADAGLTYLDGYIFAGNSAGQIYNSDPEDASTWTASNFLTAELFPDGLVNLARQQNQILAFGVYSTELFQDVANPFGSPLQSTQGAAIQIGCAAKDSVVTAETSVVWVGGANDGGFAVWRLDGLTQLRKISSENIERYLNAEDTTLDEAYAYNLRSDGHMWYVLNLVTENITFVYDYEEEMWHEWQDTSGDVFNCVAATQVDEQPILQGADDGKTYIMSPTYKDDNGTNFTVTIQTSIYDFDTLYRKMMPRFELYGDTEDTTVGLQYSDDDYTTWSTSRTINLDVTRKWLRNLGSFRRRSFKITNTDNTALRLQGMEVDILLGQH